MSDHFLSDPEADNEWLRANAGSVVTLNGNHRHDARPVGAKTKEGRLAWRRLSEIEMRSIRFADKPLLQCDAFHLVVGRKGQGKGTLLSEIAARVTRGELGEKRTVLWIGSEDSDAIDLKPRIIAAGGDDGGVIVGRQGWVQLPRDLDEVAALIDEVGDVGMVVIDPIGNHIAGKDSNSETDIREAIGPLNTLADEHQCMIFGVRHLSEKECRQSILSSILGTSAWVQVPRAVLAVVRDPEDPESSHVQCVAGNRLPPETPGRTFRIEGVKLPGLEEEITRIVWTGESTRDVTEMLAAPANRQTSKSTKARELILDILENEGAQESDTLDARVAKETGLGARTVQNIRTKLNTDEGLVRSIKERDESGEFVCWKVARTAAPRS